MFIFSNCKYIYIYLISFNAYIYLAIFGLYIFSQLIYLVYKFISYNAFLYVLLFYTVPIFNVTDYTSSLCIFHLFRNLACLNFYIIYYIIYVLFVFLACIHIYLFLLVTLCAFCKVHLKA